MLEDTPYDQMGIDSITYMVATEVGLGFTMGVVGGFTYHLAKGLVSPHPSQAFRLACQNGPRVGGALAVFAGVASGVQIIDKYARNGKDDYFSVFTSMAAGAAAARAKHGFRSASFAALGVGTVFTLYAAWITRAREKSRLSSS